MSAPVTLLLVVGLSGGEVRSGQLRATLDAQLDSRQVRIVVRRADGVANLPQMLEAASLDGPVAVVTNPRRGRLEIRVALQPGQWVRRTFDFSPRDPLRERNRTVALAIAAMTPEWRLPEPLPEPEPEPELPQPLPPLGAPVPRPEPGPVEDAAAAADAGTPVDAGTPALEAAPLAVADAGVAASPAEPAPLAVSPGGLRLELGALGGTWPLAAGAQLGGGYCWGARCLGVLVRGQRSNVSAAQAQLWQAGVLLAGRLEAPLAGQWLRGALQLSAGPAFTLAQRGAQSQSRWQLEGELGPELAVRAFSTLWLFVRLGVGLRSGPTPIFVNATQVSELPIYWGQAAAGVQLGR